MAINTLSSLPILGPLRQSAGNRPGQLPRPIPPVGRRQWQRGYTLVEIALTLIIIGVLASLADASYEASLYRAKVATAASDITMIAMAASRFQLERNRYPTDLAEVGKATMLDPWGHAYGYVDHASSPPGKWRKDKNIHPISSVRSNVE